MVFKKKLLISFIAVFALGLVNFSSVAFAEGDTVCTGRITGVTKVYNANSGVISFNSHSGPGAEDSQPVSLGVVAPGVNGLAPGNRSDAACVNKEADTAYGEAYDYALKGWAWDTNGGFVSMNCKAGFNNAGGSNVACGAIDYGVYVSADKGGGNRDLFGYAWSPTFGWISMKGEGGGGAFTYGVKIDANGKTSGHAWTQAQVYIDFSGLTLYLPDKEIVEGPAAGWCDGKPYLCVEISPDSATKVADGQDGYNVDLYFRDKDGNPIDPGAVIKNTGDIKFAWNDTVKLDQITKVNSDLDGVKSPWNSGLGGVTFKPLAFTDFKKYLDPDTGLVVPGHYVSKSIVASYAPTSEAKLSTTTSTKPAYYVNNESFLYPPDGTDVATLEKNQLALQAISFPNLLDANDEVLIPAGVVYPNGKINLPFKFKPAVFVDTLYANDFQDSILAYRSVPFIVKRGLKQVGNLGEVNGTAEFHMTYSDSETAAVEPNCSGANGYNFNVKDGLEGSTVTGPSADVTISSSISDLIGQVYDLQIDAEVISDPNGDLSYKDLPCQVAKGTTFYSKIIYSVGGNTIQYYDNKLPRIGGDSIINPAVVVHGNIFAQASGTVRGDQRVQTSGSVNINIIRDAINENLQKYTDQDSLASKVDADCTITSLSANGAIGLGACPKGQSSYLQFDVGSEHVFYSKGDVTLALGSGDWGGKWVIIADGGNIFIDKNVYASDANKSKMSLIAFRSSKDADYYKTGNIYIAPCVNGVSNVQGTFVADGSVFSYNGDHSAIKADSGEPVWANSTDMIKSLSCQLLFQGAIYSDNTIGGANLDQGTDPKKFLLSGGGNIIKLPASISERMKAQYYDLNYLRMFRLDLQLSKEGLPIDQKCGKAWTPQDQLDLLAGKTICGEKLNDDGSPCTPDGGSGQMAACDGINPLVKFGEDISGDLMVPKDNANLAQGLDNTKDFDPVYVYYLAPDKDSFVFSKQGAIGISGK